MRVSLLVPFLTFAVNGVMSVNNVETCTIPSVSAEASPSTEPQNAPLPKPAKPARNYEIDDIHMAKPISPKALSNVKFLVNWLKTKKKVNDEDLLQMIEIVRRTIRYTLSRVPRKNQRSYYQAFQEGEFVEETFKRLAGNTGLLFRQLQYILTFWGENWASAAGKRESMPVNPAIFKTNNMEYIEHVNERTRFGTLTWFGVNVDFESLKVTFDALNQTNTRLYNQSLSHAGEAVDFLLLLSSESHFYLACYRHYAARI